MSLHDTACEQRVPELDHCHRKVCGLWCVGFLFCSFCLVGFLLSFFFFQLLMLTWNFLFPELPLARQMFPSMHSFLHRPAFLVPVSPELDPAFQMCSSSAEQKRNIISPGLLAARGAATLLGHKLTLLAHICPPSHRDLFCCSWASLSLPWCLGFFLCRGGASLFPLLIFMGFLHPILPACQGPSEYTLTINN